MLSPYSNSGRIEELYQIILLLRGIKWRMFNNNLHLEVFKNRRFQGRRNMGARGATVPIISEEGTKPRYISEDGAKNGLEFTRASKFIHYHSIRRISPSNGRF